MNESVEKLCRALGVEFQDAELLRRALTHRSAGGPNNERLEFLGDAILGFLVAEQLYHRFPDAPEGDLSRFRASVVRKESLADMARGLQLGEYLRLGPGELRSGGFRRDSILADAFESLLAAVYLDGGMDHCRELVDRLFGERIAQLPGETTLKDPKTRLQEYLQARGFALPVYEVKSVTGKAHAQSFLVECRAPDIDRSAEGRGSSRRRAEQSAAEQMLQMIETG